MEISLPHSKFCTAARANEMARLACRRWCARTRAIPTDSSKDPGAGVKASVEGFAADRGTAVLRSVTKPARPLFSKPAAVLAAAAATRASRTSAPRTWPWQPPGSTPSSPCVAIPPRRRRTSLAARLAPFLCHSVGGWAFAQRLGQQPPPTVRCCSCLRARAQAAKGAGRQRASALTSSLFFASASLRVSTFPSGL